MVLVAFIITYVCIAGAYGLTYDHPTSTKNREADAGNPNVNVYHSIEDLQDDRKVEHLYDEIKQKEGQGKLTRCGSIIASEKQALHII